MQSKETWIIPTITGAAIADAVQAAAEHLEANPAAVDALALAGLEDYTSKRREMGLDGDLTPEQQHRAIARYAYLMGYALALGDMAEEINGVNGDDVFYLRVDGDEMEPDILDGDLIGIARAECTADLQRAKAVAIRKDGRTLIGRLIMHSDGTTMIIQAHGDGTGHLEPFDPAADFIGPVVSIRRSLARAD
jgi:hypothetical protein